MTAQERIEKAWDGFEQFDQELGKLIDSRALGQVLYEEVEGNGMRRSILEPLASILHQRICEALEQLTAIHDDLHNTLYGKE